MRRCLAFAFEHRTRSRSAGVRALVLVAALAAVPAWTTVLPAQQPYAEVVPAGAETDRGLFDVHRVDDRILFEIPDAMLGRDMLVMSRYAAAQPGFSLDGTAPAPEMVVRWERRGDRILLRAVSHQTRADEHTAVWSAVERANAAPILAALDVAARGEASSVVDVSDLYVGGAAAFEIGAAQRRARDLQSLDRRRSYVESVRSFPINIEVRAVVTYPSSNPPSHARGGAVTAVLNHSMVLLPEEPMRRRWYDERVGLGGIVQEDYTRDYQGVAQVRFIRRFRLEPSDVEAYRRGELVEPVRPWIWYIDPATPPEWIPYFEAGLLEWNEAFEAAGFRNAIQVRVAPTAEEDADFSLEDARYSVVRYVATPVRSANAGGGAWDPRSGELIRGHINMYHGLMERMRWMLFSQMGARHPDLRGDDVPTELMGEALRYVISHELAHVVGLPHNQMGNVAFPTDSLRSRSFIEEWGHAASVVGRARFNYIAQPGDDIPELEARRVGVADKFAVRWGYGYMPDHATPDDEWPALDALVREHAGRPWFRFLEGQYVWDQEWDPRRMTESMGDDLVRSSELGLANLKRLMPTLVERVSVEGGDYRELENHYLQIITQWARFIQHATVYVGGVYTHLKRHGEDGPIFSTVPRDEQLRAMAWLDAHAFSTPEWLLDKNVLRLLEHAGAVERVRAYQAEALDRFLQPNRLARMIEQEYFMGEDAYSPAEMLDDFRAMLWRELARATSIDPFRRNLQRAYLDRIDWILHEARANHLVPPPSGNLRVSSYDDPPLNAELHIRHSDMGALLGEQLRLLRREIEDARARSPDRNTRIHLEDVLARVDAILAKT